MPSDEPQCPKCGHDMIEGFVPVILRVVKPAVWQPGKPQRSVWTGTKLRRNESFTVSWQHPYDSPTGRTTIWLHAAIPLRFVFDSPVPEELDTALLQELAMKANSTAGLTLEPSYTQTLAPVIAEPAAA